MNVGILARQVAALRDKLDDHTIKLNAIYLAVCPPTWNQKDLNLPTFPLKSEENIAECEEFLNEKTHICVVRPNFFLNYLLFRLISFFEGGGRNLK